MQNPEVYRVWEDARAEKKLILTKENNPKYAYVANYPWLFFADNSKLHIVGYFDEKPSIECQTIVKIVYENRFQVYERHEQFPFRDEEGDTYEIENPGWNSIEITFNVTHLYGKPYEAPEKPTDFGIIVNVGEKKIYVDPEFLAKESEELSDFKTYGNNSEFNISGVKPDLFLEMLRVIRPPFKMISRSSFLGLLLLACRFKMRPLLSKVEEFTTSSEYNKKWMTKFALEKLDEILNENCPNIKILEEFRVARRRERPLKHVTIRDPEVEVIHEDVTVGRRQKSWLGVAVGWCYNHKTRIIFTLLFFLFFENLSLFLWFLCIYKEHC